MQRSKHLRKTLSFTALLAFMTVQATGVDSLPSGVHPLRQHALFLRPAVIAEVVDSVEQHLPETKGLLSYVARPTGNAKSAALAVSPGVQDESATDVPQEPLPGTKRHFSTAFFTDVSPKRRFPNEHLLARLRRPSLHFTGSTARERSCEDGRCLPYLHWKLPKELRYLLDKLYRAVRQLQDLITVHHDVNQRRTLPQLTQELRALPQSVDAVGVSPPISDGVDYHVSWVEHYNIDPSSLAMIPLTGVVTRVKENDTGHPATLYNWQDVYRSYNNLHHLQRDDLSGSTFPHDFNGLEELKRLVRNTRESPEQAVEERKLALTAQDTGLIHSEVIPFLTESLFPLLARIPVTATYLHDLIDTLELATSLPIRETLVQLYQELESSAFGPLLKLVRYGYEFVTSVTPADLLSSNLFGRQISEDTDTASNDFVETMVEEVATESTTQQPRSRFRLWPLRSKRSDETTLRLLKAFIGQIIFAIDAGIMRARSINVYGALDYFLKEAQHVVKKLSTFDLPPPLDKMLKFLEIVLDRIAPKEKRTERNVPLSDQGNGAFRPKQWEVNGVDKDKESVIALEDVFLGEMSPTYQLSRLWHNGNRV